MSYMLVIQAWIVGGGGHESNVMSNGYDAGLNSMHSLGKCRRRSRRQQQSRNRREDMTNRWRRPFLLLSGSLCSSSLASYLARAHLWVSLSETHGEIADDDALHFVRAVGQGPVLVAGPQRSLLVCGGLHASIDRPHVIPTGELLLHEPISCSPCAPSRFDVAGAPLWTGPSDDPPDERLELAMLRDGAGSWILLPPGSQLCWLSASPAPRRAVPVEQKSACRRKCRRRNSRIVRGLPPCSIMSAAFAHREWPSPRSRISECGTGLATACCPCLQWGLWPSSPPRRQGCRGEGAASASEASALLCWPLPSAAAVGLPCSSRIPGGKSRIGALRGHGKELCQRGAAKT
eukprot:scaffold301_cov243-Pinguiococcus_pyrenoidosus.AAC.132